VARPRTLTDEQRIENRKKAVLKYNQSDSGRLVRNLATAKSKRNNKGKVNARNAKRRALRVGASVGNTEIDNMCITILYRLAAARGDYHVDHIHPLSKGGAHHPMNLQILTAEENLKKSDSVE